MNDEPAVVATDLRKSYGANAVLRGIDLTVPKGSVYALLGPNGAGKTTTVRILATLADADAGSARVAGYDVRRERAQVRRRISLTGQDVSLDALQTGAENLQMMGRLRRLSAAEARARATRLLEMFELTDAGDRRVGTYSGGMRRRLDLAAGLVRRPEVIFLDEPTTGLDPRSRQGVGDVVAELAAYGVTILLTTQYLEEADRLADRIAVIDGGTVVAEGTAAELKHKVAGRRVEIRCRSAAAYDEMHCYLGGLVVRADPQEVTLDVSVDGSADGSAAREVRALLDEIDPGRDRVAEFTVHTASLDDVFLSLTGHHAADKESADV